MISGQDNGDFPVSMEETEQALWAASAAMFDKGGRSLDLVHARISLDYGLRLFRELGGSRRIVVPAIMLHDIGNVAISDPNLEKKTINPGTAASKKRFSVELKQMHLQEGKTLSEQILQQVGYPPALIPTISDIVGDHENPMGGPPENLDSIEKVIVSDADKLYRYSANGIFAMCRIHDITDAEMLCLNYAKIDEWLITGLARRIAKEELRKTSGARDLAELMGWSPEIDAASQTGSGGFQKTAKPI